MLSKDLEAKQKFCWITYIKIKNPKYPPFKNLPFLMSYGWRWPWVFPSYPQTMCLTCSTTSCWSSSRSTRTPRIYRYTVYRLLWMGIFYSWLNKTYIFYEYAMEIQGMIAYLECTWIGVSERWTGGQSTLHLSIPSPSGITKTLSWKVMRLPTITLKVCHVIKYINIVTLLYLFLFSLMFCKFCKTKICFNLV